MAIFSDNTETICERDKNGKGVICILKDKKENKVVARVDAVVMPNGELGLSRVRGSDKEIDQLRRAIEKYGKISNEKRAIGEF